MTNAITGGCHCGEVRYRISVAPYVQQFVIVLIAQK